MEDPPGKHGHLACARSYRGAIEPRRFQNGTRQLVYACHNRAAGWDIYFLSVDGDEEKQDEIKTGEGCNLRLFV
jgi:hypothetical protein